MSENRVIGRGGRLPWHLPADLQHFKKLTTGHAIIMGRKTFESIGRALPQRRSIVVTRNPKWSAAGVETAPNLHEAIKIAGRDNETFIIGGEEIFRAALPIADRIHLTLIHATVEGDAFMPQFRDEDWVQIDQRDHIADDRNPHAFSFRTLQRKRLGDAPA